MGVYIGACQILYGTGLVGLKTISRLMAPLNYSEIIDVGRVAVASIVKRDRCKSPYSFFEAMSVLGLEFSFLCGVGVTKWGVGVDGQAPALNGARRLPK
jgi:hypothetical protein